MIVVICDRWLDMTPVLTQGHVVIRWETGHRCIAGHTHTHAKHTLIPCLALKLTSITRASSSSCAALINGEHRRCITSHLWLGRVVAAPQPLQHPPHYPLLHQARHYRDAAGDEARREMSPRVGPIGAKKHASRVSKSVIAVETHRRRLINSRELTKENGARSNWFNYGYQEYLFRLKTFQLLLR